QWKAHEVEMVEVVADQVAVALSHAAVLEETQRRRDELEEKNRTLQAARQRAEVAVMARNDFLAVMNHEMRTPLHSITALASILNVSVAAVCTSFLPAHLTTPEVSTRARKQR
ncbi:unnamed protein product, partial [Closterium sp. NIES-53]